MAPTTPTFNVNAAITAAATITTRQFRAADHAAVLTLFQEGMLAYADHSSNAGTLAYIQRSMETDLADIPGVFILPGGNFWVATMAGSSSGEPEVVGMVALEKKTDGAGELRRMSVKKEARRFGVGKLLVMELEQWAKQNGFDEVTLTTGEVMTVAQEFYRSVGYTQQETIVVYEDPYYADVRFTKQL